MKKQLLLLYDERETVAIAHEVIEHITGLDKINRLLNKDNPFTYTQEILYRSALASLLFGRPMQYVLKKAWFMGCKFYVDEDVLIPRPETEELVQWVVDDVAKSECTILDIGTGSGCIAISLKMALPTATITGCDISEGALTVAKKNANNLSTPINLVQLDILDVEQQNKLTKYDIIVSNPPYIPISKKQKLHTNVSVHEPGIALFVPSRDPLLFYKAIAKFGKTHLQPYGYIYCELEYSLAEQCKTLFETEGYKQVEIRKDMHDNWRMLKAGKWV